MDLLSDIASCVAGVLREDINPKIADYGGEAEVVDVEMEADGYVILLAFSNECYDKPGFASLTTRFIETFISTEYGVECRVEDVAY